MASHTNRTQTQSFMSRGINILIERPRIFIVLEVLFFLHYKMVSTVSFYFHMKKLNDHLVKI